MKVDLDKVLAEMGKEREGVLHLQLSKALFEIEKLRARLAAVEAERDAARAGEENKIK